MITQSASIIMSKKATLDLIPLCPVKVVHVCSEVIVQVSQSFCQLLWGGEVIYMDERVSWDMILIILS